MITSLTESMPISREPVQPLHEMITEKGQFSEILENWQGLDEQRGRRQAFSVMTMVGNMETFCRNSEWNHIAEM